MSALKLWGKTVGVPMIHGIVFGFILAHVILLPFLIFTSLTYLPMSILIGNFVGSGILGIVFTIEFFRTTLPAHRAREAALDRVTKEM